MYRIFKQVLSLKTNEFEKMIKISDQAKRKQSQLIHRFVVIGDETKQDFRKQLEKQRERLIHFAIKQTIIIFWFVVLFVTTVTVTRFVPENTSYGMTTMNLSLVSRAVLLFLMFHFNESIYNRCCVCTHKVCILCCHETKLFHQSNQTVDNISTTESSKSPTKTQVKTRSLVLKTEM